MSGSTEEVVMEIIDITLPLHAGTLVYEGDPPFEATQTSRVVKDNPGSLALSILSMGSHSGTHIDAPRHFVEPGGDVEGLDLHALCGPARVVDLRGRGRRIDESTLRSLDLEGVTRLLMKTDNSELLGASAFRRDYTHLTREGAVYLRRELELRLIGIDYLSVDPWPDPWPGFDFPAHHALLDPEPSRSPVVIVESLDLRRVAPGDYELWCLPLKLRGLDGAPVRAVLCRR
jgi:arylformamidase